MVIYADSLFFVNMAVNFLVLLASDRLCGLNASRWRIGAGAALGGAYSVMALFVPFFQQLVVKLTAGVFMTMAAFGGHRRLFRIILTVFGLSATFAGVIYALTIVTSETGVSFRTTVFALGICYFIVSLLFRRLSRPEAVTVRVTVLYRGRRAEFSALRDTGNSLSDPITGAPVVIADRDAVSGLFGDALPDCPPDRIVSAMGKLGHSFRLIPYSAVGVEGGLLAAFRPDEAVIDGRAVKGCLIALSPNAVSDGGAYSALIGVGNY